MFETGRKVTMKEDMKGEVSEGSVDEVVWKWIARGGCACKKGTFFLSDTCFQHKMIRSCGYT